MAVGLGEERQPEGKLEHLSETPRFYGRESDQNLKTVLLTRYGVTSCYQCKPQK